MNETPQANFDQSEVGKFNDLADHWWDQRGEFRPLHEINPLRLDYIDRLAGIQGKRAIDVGCGGGILSEGLARRGAAVTGLDMAEAPLAVARDHAAAQSLEIDYRASTAEQEATSNPGAYDLVTCLEMLEHVPDPASTIAACAALARPGGDLFFSTINRNPKSFMLAIVGAEYLLRMLPKGTHDYARFIRPSELASWIRHAGLELHDVSGLQFNPLTGAYRLGRDTDVNYLVHVRKPQ